MRQAVREPRKLIPAAEVFAEWQKDPAYREANAALEDEFAIMAALIRARTAAGLTQGEVAERMQTTQPAVARLEGQAHRVVIRVEQVGGEGVRLTHPTPPPPSLPSHAAHPACAAGTPRATAPPRRRLAR